MRAFIGAMAALAVMGNLAAGSAARAAEPTKITVMYTAAFDVAPAFTAKERGFFAKRNLDVDFKLAPNGSVIVAGLVADGVQIGTPTIPIMLQAAESGIDTVVVSGISHLGPTAEKIFRVVNRKDFNPTKAEDYIGRKVGVPGIGGTLTILFVEWLKRNGVDPAKVTIVETPFPTMPDALKAGSVDAIVGVEPFVTRSAQVGGGSIGVSVAKGLPSTMPGVVFAATRAWADKNAEAARGFKAAIAEAMAFAKDHPDDLRTDTLKYIKIPPPVMAKLDIPDFDANVEAAGIAEWDKIMLGQQGVKATLKDPASMIFK